MEKIAVFVNDLDAARHTLQPLLAGEGPTHWVLVACPPTLTRHIGRWVSHTARQQWRERWAAELFGALRADLKGLPTGQIETLIAKRPLADLSAQLLARMPQLRLIDARRLRAGRVEEPIGPARVANSWAAPVAATAGLSLVLALAD